MKKILFSSLLVPTRAVIVLFLLLFLVLAFKIAVTSTSAQEAPPPSKFLFTMGYLEDESGELILDEVKSKAYSKKFISKSGSTLPVGQSRSTWWVRLKVQDWLSVGNGMSYLTISNPTVEKVNLYLPVNDESGVKYITLHSGWGCNKDTEEQGYSYPIFRIPENISKADDIYIQLKSPYIQCYTIELLQFNELLKLRQKNILLIGILFGVLIAVGIFSLINFAFMRDRAYIYYAIYILFVLVDQSALLGVLGYFNISFSDALIGQMVSVSLFMLIAAILFCRAFLNMEENFPRQDRLFQPVFLITAGGVILMLMEMRIEASTLLTISAIFSVALMVWTAFNAFRRGYQQARYFFAGWSIIFIGMIIFSARAWGVIPNSGITSYSLLIAAVAESILLSVALADRVKVLRNEKDHAIMLYKDAKESSRVNEMAFLQAQIKPHFLYNSLNVIAALCRLDAEKARSLLLDLSSYLHHTFSQKKLTQLVPFEEELAYIMAYVNIEQARFRDKVTMEYDIENTDGLILPPLILQPLVENAIRHGIRKSDKAGKVILHIRRVVNDFIITVEDNGVGMSLEQLQTVGRGVGLTNIERRLQMHYGTQLKIESKLGQGTKVMIKIPLEREKVERN